MKQWFWQRRLADYCEGLDARQRPRDANGVVRGAEAFRLEGNNGEAVILVHGFNDTPQSMRYLAERLHAAGYTVDVPRLAGHGATLASLARDADSAVWRAQIHGSHEELRRSHSLVHICGQSMGGALAALEVSLMPDTPSLVLLAPYLNMPLAMRCNTRMAALLSVFSPFIPTSGGRRSIHDPEANARSLSPRFVTSEILASFRRVARSAYNVLPSIAVPTLYLQSREDNRVTATRAEHYFSRLGRAEADSGEKRLLWLEGCGHVISSDYCRDRVADEVIAWISTHGMPLRLRER